MSNRNLSGAQFFPNPAYAGSEAAQEYEDSDDYFAVQEVEGFSPDSEETVDPSELFANQDTLNESSVRHFAGRGHEPIEVVESQGSRWIWDGNHRAEAARRLKQPVRARIMRF